MKNKIAKNICAPENATLIPEFFITQFNSMLKMGAKFYAALEEGDVKKAQKLLHNVQKFYRECGEGLQELSWENLVLKKLKGQEETPLEELIKLKKLMLQYGKSYEENSLEKLILLRSEKRLLGIPRINIKDFMAQFEAILETGPWFFEELKKGEVKVAEKLLLSVQGFYSEYTEELQELPWEKIQLIKLQKLMEKCGKMYEENSLGIFFESEKRALGMPIINKTDFIVQLNNILKIGAQFYKALQNKEDKTLDKLFSSIQTFLDVYEEELKLSWEHFGLKKQNVQEEAPFSELIKIKELMLKCGIWHYENPLDMLILSDNEKRLLGIIEMKAPQVGCNDSFFKRKNGEINLIDTSIKKQKLV